MKNMLIPVVVITALLLAFAVTIFAQTGAIPSMSAPAPAGNDPFANYPVYRVDDLGVRYTPAETFIRVWSPPAAEMQCRLYNAPAGGDPVEEVACVKNASGVWTATLKGDRKNLYYTVRAKIGGQWSAEVPDPYAKAVGTNGLRGQIVNLRETDPPGWGQDQAPGLKSPTDAVIYELHVRDLSADPGSGIKNKGKFLALTEPGTVNKHRQSTGIDHIAELGVTHVHLLPVFDFYTVDESKPDVPQYNWGYDPLNYNVPEGSYSTNPADGKVRIREFKQMVQAMHKKGLRVIMDVVYNHVARMEESSFDQLVPGYYFRKWDKAGFSNGSGCGNETASERPMMRKFIIESVTYWAREYHVDGFRFDLMGLHDLETMNQLATELRAINPSVIIYGEGWTAGDTPLPLKDRALKVRAKDMTGVAVFSDDIRDAIKGSVFDDAATGFASGSKDATETVRVGIVAAGDHPQVDYARANYAKEPYTKSPSEVINYVACHDNHTLYDKLKVSRPDAPEEDIVKMHKLANTIVFTAQGIPFLHAGEELKRTKGGDHNSYNKPDAVNRIDWDWKYENRELFDYYKSLIALRKAHPAFRMTDAKMVAVHLAFLGIDDPQMVAFQLNDNANGDPWSRITVIFNGSADEKSIPLPGGTWKVALMDYRFQPEGRTLSIEAVIAPYSAMILYQD